MTKLKQKMNIKTFTSCEIKNNHKQKKTILTAEKHTVSKIEAHKSNENEWESF